MALGEYASEVAVELRLKRKSYAWIPDFYHRLRLGYSQAAELMIEKLPLTNPTLIALTALEPSMQRVSTTAAALEELGKKILPDATSHAKLAMEARFYCTDVDVRNLSKKYKDAPDKRIDSDFWSHVFKLKTVTCKCNITVLLALTLIALSLSICLHQVCNKLDN